MRFFLGCLLCCAALFSQDNIYPNKMKNWDFGLAKASGFERSKRPSYSNMGDVLIVESRELWLEPKTNSSACLGIDIALEKYTAAERAQDPSERSALFNEALTLFLSAEKEVFSGQLFYNIANTYYYLGRNGLAIAYYRRAEVQLPRDRRVQKNLQIALQKAEVEHKQIERPLADIIGFRIFSPYERSLFCIGAIFFTLIMFSFNLYFSGFRSLWRICAGLTGMFLFFIFIYSVIIPPRAVVLKVTPIWAAPDKGSNSTTTLSSGEMVEVISSEQRWLKVRTSAHITGYVISTSVMFVER